MSRKPNPLLAQFEAKLQAQYAAKLDIALNMGLDAAMITAHDVLGMGPGRAENFRTKYIETINQMSQMMVEDSADDPDIVYSRELIDRKIKSIVGPENFKEWDDRYNQRRRAD